MNLDDLIYELIAKTNNNSLIKQYNDKENLFNSESVKNTNDFSLLTEKYNEFSKLLNDFQRNYKKLYAIAVDLGQEGEDRAKAKIYMDIGVVYLNIIQNLYLNPINYQINKLKSEESLLKAEESIELGINSICWAKISILIAIVSFIISIVISSIGLSKTIFYGKNPTPCSCCAVESSSVTVQPILEQDNCKVENKILTLEADTTKQHKEENRGK